jgi:hypothetical protein
MISMQVKGILETLKNLNALNDDRIPSALKDGLVKASAFVLTRLQQNTPVDTGRLQSSARVMIDEDNFFAVVGPDEAIAPYGIWVEQGHHTRNGHWVKGQFFIQRTALETEKEVDEIFKAAIKIALE